MLRVLVCFLCFLTYVSAQPYSIVVYKAKRTMHILKDNKVFKIYKIALSKNSLGPKQFMGDKKTPEGKYKISGKNPHSQFYKSLRISYPAEKDIKHARAHGKDPGGDIMIHGLGKEFSWLGKAHVLHDWTLGCVAVTNEEMQEIYDMIPVGCPVKIFP